MAFLEELETSLPKQAFRLYIETDPVRVSDFLQVEANLIPGDARVYLCGPGPFMAAAETIFSQYVPNSAIRLEHFKAEDTPALSGDSSFEIELTRSGMVVEVAATESIIDALARAGIEVPTSCEQGICGTCLTAVVAGTPDHRDMFLTQEEQASGNEMCLCVSRSFSEKLVLDL